MDKSLKHIGNKIQVSEKQCADRLKKKMDESASIKNKLAALARKSSKNFL
jgi:predicted DNA-binding protein YlxM (UPF0122 family)